jgi:hypothetical protein
MAGSGFAPCRTFRVGTKNVPTLPSGDFHEEANWVIQSNPGYLN